MQIFDMQTCKHANMQIFKYAMHIMQNISRQSDSHFPQSGHSSRVKICKYLICKHAYMQTCKYSNMQIFKYANIWYANMQTCKYSNMQTCILYIIFQGRMVPTIRNRPRTLTSCHNTPAECKLYLKFENMQIFDMQTCKHANIQICNAYYAFLFQGTQSGTGTLTSCHNTPVKICKLS